MLYSTASASETTNIAEAVKNSAAVMEATASPGSCYCEANAELLRNGHYEECPSLRYCKTRGVFIPNSLAEEIHPRPRQVGAEIPHFVPLVNALDPRTYAHNYLKGKFRYIAVQVWPLLQNRTGYQRVASKGLKETLGYDGEVILSSVMPDKYIMRDGVERLIAVIKELQPDIALTNDVPTYVDHPRFASLNWLLKGIEGARMMASALDTPLIGLVSGASIPQVELSSRALHALGFDYQALPSLELVKGRKISYLKEYIATIKRNCASLMVLSCSSPRLMSRIHSVDNFVGMGWFHQTYRGKFVLDSRPRYKSMTKSQYHRLATENLVALMETMPNPQVTLEETLRLG